MSEITGAAPSAQPVENPIQATTPEPAPQDPGNNVAPAAAPGEPSPQPSEPPAEPKVYQPGDPEALLKILDGADPETLFGQKQPAAEPNPQEPPGEPKPPGEEPPAPTEPQDQIPDKFKNPDGSLNAQALLQSYTGLEKKLGEQGNTLGQMTQLQQQIQQLQGHIQQMQQPAAQPQPESAPAEEAPKFPWEVEMTPEEKEKALEEYYNDPLSAQAKRDQQTIKAMDHRFSKMLKETLAPLAPVVQTHQHNQQVSQFNQQIAEFTKDGQNADFFDLQPEMKEIIKEYGDEITKLKNPVKAIYDMAKGMRAPSGPPEPAPTFDELLKDPNNLQKVLANSEIKNQILQGYVKDVKDGQPPVTIGGQPGGSPPAAPSEKPRSVREASSIFARFLRQQ